MSGHITKRKTTLALVRAEDARLPSARVRVVLLARESKTCREVELEVRRRQLRPRRATRSRRGEEGNEGGEGAGSGFYVIKDQEPRVVLEGGDVELVLVQGPGPWRLTPGARAHILGVDGLCYCPKRESQAAKEARAELAAYGLATSSDVSSQDDPLLEKGLVALFGRQDKDAPACNAQSKDPSRLSKVLDTIGRTLISCASVQIPMVLCKPFAFLRMTKVDAKAPRLRCCDASAVVSLIEHRGQQMRLLAAPGASMARYGQTAACLVFDMLLGVIVGVCLTLREREIGDFLFDSVGYQFQSGVMRKRVLWVLSQHAPLGFKLNEGLDEVLGNTVLFAIESWHVFTAQLAPFGPQLLFTIGVLSLLGGGLSMVLAFACDAASFVTLHIQFLYNFFARLHRFQLAGMSTFWKVMRGKKRNVLRGRVDTGDYATGDLLFGSMAFLVFGFLFQTTLAYYVMFVGLWLLTVVVHGLLLIAIKMLQCAPIYAVGQTVVRPTRYPRGVVLDLCQEPWGAALELRGLYIGVGEILGAWMSLIGPFGEWARRHDTSGFAAAIRGGHQISLAQADFPRYQDDATTL
ncbi:Phosphatidylinositol N-acetylglucosaminyltransferase subunit Q [Hondaea fermentalgiana]|uniref:Phosphatidylinositol N-acetylglucosaminyltransferase subunit Q n=1 Tax=Hondaea fermentalgiana TaxID=2315210 RepID=A0A2R5GM28_9STRA|nr:Phosphatidylinositol N-acetylglucosaminyltransferase subunit Q [Hondaea fermentalgiana]|eukprot:GBG28924.1 Phosphatidylinositol N-acetylglucosaminyltransferase subunit Q [Hondaea fermentalgiana]